MPHPAQPQRSHTHHGTGLRVGGAFLLVFAGIALGTAGGTLIAWLAGWGLDVGSGGAPVVFAGTMAGLVWAMSAAVGLTFLALLARSNRDNLGFAVLASSIVRMLGALGMGLLLYFSLGPDGRTFWVAFLLAGLGALAAETAWAVRMLNPLPSAPAAGFGAR